MRLLARGAAFDVFLGEMDGPLHQCASWQDRNRTYQEGAIGVWEHGGEAGEYRNMHVETLDGATAN
jgi:hypothetical protein